MAGLERMLSPAPWHPAAPPITVSKAEWWWLGVMLAGLFALDLLTYNYYPTVWCDDVSFSEPAINFVKTGCVTTTVWQFQPLNTFPSVNCPGYILALCGWLSLVGTSLLAVRSFNFLLMGVATGLVWIISWKLNLVRSRNARLVLLPLVHLGYGISFSYRCSRPDILSLVLLLCLCLAFQLRRAGLRRLMLLLLSVSIPFIALQAALFAGFACLVAWVCFRYPRFPELATVAVGLALGGCLVAGFLAAHGVLTCFLTGISHIAWRIYSDPHATGLVALPLLLIKRIVVGCFGDFSTGALLLGLGALGLLRAWGRLSAFGRRFLVFSLTLVFGVPAVFTLAGHYGFYYSYLLYVPAVLGYLAVGCELVGKPYQAVLIASSLVAVATGLPMRLGLTGCFSKVTPRREIQQIIDSHITADDIVFTDEAVFFEVKQRARTVYTRWSSYAFQVTPVPGRDFSPAEKQSVSVLVIRPEKAEFCTNYFAGQWSKVDALFGDHQDLGRIAGVPLIGRKLASHFSQPQVERVPLQIYRKGDSRP